jgi:hypothetical protein
VLRTRKEVFKVIFSPGRSIPSPTRTSSTLLLLYRIVVGDTCCCALAFEKQSCQFLRQRTTFEEANLYRGKGTIVFQPAAQALTLVSVPTIKLFVEPGCCQQRSDLVDRSKG